MSATKPVSYITRFLGLSMFALHNGRATKNPFSGLDRVRQTIYSTIVSLTFLGLAAHTFYRKIQMLPTDMIGPLFLCVLTCDGILYLAGITFVVSIIRHGQTLHSVFHEFSLIDNIILSSTLSRHYLFRKIRKFALRKTIVLLGTVGTFLCLHVLEWQSEGSWAERRTVHLILTATAIFIDIAITQFTYGSCLSNFAGTLSIVNLLKSVD
jgi:hypothetical protein